MHGSMDNFLMDGQNNMDGRMVGWMDGWLDIKYIYEKIDGWLDG